MNWCNFYDWGWLLVFIVLIAVCIWMPFRLARNLGMIEKGDD